VLNATRNLELSNAEQLLAVKLEDRVKELSQERESLRGERERME
jgi:hypothetical protein